MNSIRALIVVNLIKIKIKIKITINPIYFEMFSSFRFWAQRWMIWFSDFILYLYVTKYLICKNDHQVYIH